LSLACSTNTSPTKTGFRKLTRSIDAVTALVCACRCATKPATRSICFRIYPPKTLPDGFAFEGNIRNVISDLDMAGLFALFKMISCSHIIGILSVCCNLKLDTSSRNAKHKEKYRYFQEFNI